jgi:hypothetical protein
MPTESEMGNPLNLHKKQKSEQIQLHSSVTNFVILTMETFLGKTLLDGLSILN